MYPEAEEEIKKVALKSVLSSLYEHTTTCKVCQTYLNAILEHAVAHCPQLVITSRPSYDLRSKRENSLELGIEKAENQ